MNPLPPQAYTKDTMLKAYAWVMNQPASIKELATTPDILVSLYLKAQRDGLESLERPSIQNFRDELKSLAGMMSTLSSEGMNTEAPVSESSPIISSFFQKPPTHPSPPTQVSQSAFQSLVTPQTPASTSTSSSNQESLAKPHASASSATAPLQGQTKIQTSVQSSSILYDERSLKLIREVKERLNLTSDSEAVRALLQLGYQSLKDRLPHD